MIKIKETNDLNKFIDFPFKLFKNNKYWVGDLKKETKKLLDLSHPFYRHSERKMFIAEDEKGNILARVMAIINYNYNSFQNQKCGFFGFFDSIDNHLVAKELLDKASLWLKSKGMDFILGPANPSSNEVWGLLIEGFESSNVIMMPYNPSYYIELLEKSGFKREKVLYAYKWVLEKGLPEKYEKLAQRILRNKEITIEELNLKEKDKALKIFKEIYNSSWENNWGFVPMTKEEMDDMAKTLMPILKKEYVFFIKIKDVYAGACLMLPDFNIALKDLRGSLNIFNIFSFLYKFKFKMRSGRLIALGVKKEYRNKGLELLLIKKSIENAKKLKWEWGELSWTLEDNEKINSVIESIGGFVYKKYAIYKKII